MTWGMVGAAAVTVVGGALMNSGGGGGGSSSPQTYDPYAPYRGAAATKLNDLMNNPSSLQNLPEYQAQMQAASRAMAAQGYTGSGNALVAAANAGGQAYQQAFNNLSTLAGAGQSPAYGAGMAAQQANYNQQQQNQMWGQIGGLVGSGINAWNGSSSSLPPIDDSYNYAPPTISAPDTSTSFGF